MMLGELNELIASTRWFANLGNAVQTPGVEPIRDLSTWVRFVAACTNAEFGLPCDDAVFELPAFAELEWLPTTQDEPDPVHGDTLQIALEELNKASEFSAARIEVTRLALQTQRASPDRDVLQVGPTDLNEAARMAGRIACHRAALEIIVDRVGFWCDLVRCFHQGNWPFGRLPSGEVVVL